MEAIDRQKQDERTHFYISEVIRLIAGVDPDINIENPDPPDPIMQKKLQKAAEKFRDAWHDNGFEVSGKIFDLSKSNPYEPIPVGYALDEGVQLDYWNDRIRVPALPMARSLSPYEKIWEKVKVKRSRILKIWLTKKIDSGEATRKQVGRPTSKQRIIAALKTCTPKELQLDIAKQLAPLVAEKCGQKVGDKGFSPKTLSRHISANI